MNMFNKKNGLLAFLLLGALYGLPLIAMKKLIKIEQEFENNLYTAINTNNFKEIENLIRKGADIEKPLKNDTTPLEFAISKNKLQSVKALVENGANIRNISKNNGYTTLLELAIENEKCKEIIELLIIHGADVRQHILNGRNLLELALITKKNTEITQILLNHGLEIDEKCTTSNSKPTTPLHKLLQSYPPHCNNFLNKYFIDCITVCLINGAKVNTSINGKTAWDLAIALKNKEIINVMKDNYKLYITHKNNFFNFNNLYDCKIYYEPNKCALLIRFD